MLFECSQRKLCPYLFHFHLFFSHAPNSLCLCLCLLHTKICYTWKNGIHSFVINPCVLDSCYAQFYLPTYIKSHFNSLQSISSLQYSSGQATLPKRIYHCLHKQNINVCGHDKITTAQKKLNRIFNIFPWILVLDFRSSVTLFIFTKSCFYQVYFTRMFYRHCFPTLFSSIKIGGFR